MNKLLTSLQNDKRYREAASVSYQAPFHEDGPLIASRSIPLPPEKKPGIIRQEAWWAPEPGRMQ
jgi:hypothetical protein